MLSDNDKGVLVYNAFTSAATAKDLLELIDWLPDDVRAHLYALSKELTASLRSVVLDNQARKG